MKHNASFGLQWLGRFFICLAVASLWVYIFYPKQNNNSYFESLIPGSLKLISDTGILLAASVSAFTLAPIIANNVLRWIGIHVKFLHVFILIGICYYIIVTLIPDLQLISTELDDSDLTISSLKKDIIEHKSLFWWVVIARGLVPTLIIVIPAFFLRGFKR